MNDQPIDKQTTDAPDLAIGGKSKYPATTCGFCGKYEFEVKTLIAGPQVGICNECIDLCNSIIGSQQDGEKSELDKQRSVMLRVILRAAPLFRRLAKQ